MSSQESLSSVISAGFTDESLLELPVDKLIQMGVEIRDELREQGRVFKRYEADAKGMIIRLQHALKLKGDAMGVDSFSTKEGTAYRNLKESYRVAGGEWEKVLKFMQETNNWQMLEKRVAKLATKEIHKTMGAVPPGVEYRSEESFVIRRPNERISDDE